MSPCTPLDESSFEPGDPPLGFNIGSINLPDLNIPFPDLPLENLQELFDQLGMILPPGTMKPNFEPDVLNTIYSGINDLLQKFFPFLMLYKFFLPVLNLILCIIEVLCAIANPIKLIRALRKLFRICIPEFLALFPFFALILMIISLILLIITLIEYIINRLIQIIETILRNIILLNKAASSLNNDSIIAIVKKIGDLLCVLQNLFILFAIFNTIIQIIKALLSLTFKIPPCDSGDSSDDGCCTTDVCPQFLKENEIIVSSDGYFQYLREVGIDSGLTLPAGFAKFFSTIRKESWQFHDSTLGQSQEFINITNAWDLPPEAAGTVFFPAGTNYTETTTYTGTPYYINFQAFYDPADFSRAGSPRYVKIKNAIVKEPPTSGVLDYSNTLIAPTNGTLNLIGGIITELNDAVIFDTNGKPYNINTFFHNPTLASPTLPAVDDALYFTDISYTFTINHPILVANSLITIGCVPSVAAERDYLTATVGSQFNINASKLSGISALLPDMAGGQQCVLNAITEYRKSISTDSTLQFQENVLACLNGLRQSSVNSLIETISAGYDPYKSEFLLDPEIQFTSDTIKIKVSLKEVGGNLMTVNLPPDVTDQLALKISAVTSFGEISGFVYDGSQYFVAEINSKEAGNGEIKISFDNSTMSILNDLADLDLTPSISIRNTKYTFVKSQILRGGDGGTDGSPRRDDTDISGRE